MTDLEKYTILISDYEKQLQSVSKMTIIETSDLIVDYQLNKESNYSDILNKIRTISMQNIKSLNNIKKDYYNTINQYVNLNKEDARKLNEDLYLILNRYKDEIFQIIEDKEDDLNNLRDSSREINNEIISQVYDIKLNYEVQRFEIRMIDEVLSQRTSYFKKAKFNPASIYNRVIYLSDESKHRLMIMVDDELLIDRYSKEIDALIENYSNQEKFSLLSQMLLYNEFMKSQVDEYKNKMIHENNKRKVKRMSDYYKRKLNGYNKNFNNTIISYHVDESYKLDIRDQLNESMSYFMKEIDYKEA